MTTTIPAALDVAGQLAYSAAWTPHTHALVRTLHVGDADVWDAVRAWLGARVGAPLTQAYTLTTYTLMAEPSDYVYDPAPPEAPHALGLLSKPTGWGFTNLDVYLTGWLSINNSSAVRVVLSDTWLQFTALPDTVPVLRYTRGNTCAVDTATAQRVCRMGEERECCAFLIGGGAGFACAKFDSTLERTLMDRATRGAMSARRIGGCRVAGRMADTVPEDARVNALCAAQ